MKYPILFLCLVLTACSSRQWYDAVQGSQRHQCNTLTTQEAYEECMAQYDTSYDEYTREREAVIKGQ